MTSRSVIGFSLAGLKASSTSCGAVSIYCDRVFTRSPKTSECKTPGLPQVVKHSAARRLAEFPCSLGILIYLPLLRRLYHLPDGKVFIVQEQAADQQIPVFRADMTAQKLTSMLEISYCLRASRCSTSSQSSQSSQSSRSIFWAAPALSYATTSCRLSKRSPADRTHDSAPSSDASVQATVAVALRKSLKRSCSSAAWP